MLHLKIDMYMALLRKVDKKAFLILLGCSFLALHPGSGIGQSIDSTRSWIEVCCKVPGLDIFLDGNQVGKTPMQQFAVIPGMHNLRIRHPNPYDWMSKDWTRVVDLQPGEKMVLNVVFPKQFWIGSDPPGASVYSVTGYVGETPLMVSLYPGESEWITLKKDPYEDQSICLDQAKKFFIHIGMDAAGMDDHKNVEEQKFNKRLILASSAVALLAGVTGYILKNRADRAYDRYLGTGNPDRMDRYFKDAVKFDKWSGVCYGFGEAVFVISLTWFISIHWSK